MTRVTLLVAAATLFGLATTGPVVAQGPPQPPPWLRASHTEDNNPRPAANFSRVRVQGEYSLPAGKVAKRVVTNVFEQVTGDDGKVSLVLVATLTDENPTPKAGNPGSGTFKTSDALLRYQEDTGRRKTYTFISSLYTTTDDKKKVAQTVETDVELTGE